ncbi:MAG TPA: carbon storage regulator [Pirellulales bacterium]|nr:carbon storage regulator [Pirellulales bacterium]
MLVLSRKETQQIQIGDNIVVTIVQVKGQGVKIGIEAPDDVRIVRSEIADRPPHGHKPATPAKAASGRSRLAKSKAALAPTSDRRDPLTDVCFSPPLFTINHPETAAVIGESSGLFPRLHQRSVHAAPGDDYPGPSRVMTNPSCSIIR